MGLILAASVSGGSVSIASSNVAIISDSVSPNGGGSVNVGSGTMVFPGAELGAWIGSSYSGIAGIIQAGRNGGSWDGSGIVTSMTAAQGRSSPSTLPAMRVTEAHARLAGKVKPMDVLVSYTYAGDANLADLITGDDHFRIDNGYCEGLTGYANGDFNYDGSGHARADEAGCLRTVFIDPLRSPVRHLSALPSPGGILAAPGRPFSACPCP